MVTRGWSLEPGTAHHCSWYWDLWYWVLVGVSVVTRKFPITDFLLKNKRNLNANLQCNSKLSPESIKREGKMK